MQQTVQAVVSALMLCLPCAQVQWPPEAGQEDGEEEGSCHRNPPWEQLLHGFHQLCRSILVAKHVWNMYNVGNYTVKNGSSVGSTTLLGHVSKIVSTLLMQ